MDQTEEILVPHEVSHIYVDGNTLDPVLFYFLQKYIIKERGSKEVEAIIRGIYTFCFTKKKGNFVSNVFLFG